MRPPLSSRSPTPADAEKLADLGRETFVETFGHLYRPSDLQAFLASKYAPDVIARELADPALHHQVVEDHDDLVAFIKIGPLDLPVPSPLPNAGEIKQLYVRRSHGGQGIGRHLMSWAFARMKAANLTNIYLSVFSGNDSAIRFYQQDGFRKSGEYHYPVGDHLDLEWIMVRPDPLFSEI